MLSVPMATIGLLVASVGIGLVPLFARSLTDEGFAPHAISFYRYIVGAVLLFPVLLRHMRHWRALLWGVGAGVLMGVGWVGYVIALKVAPVSTVGVIYMTYPIFTVIVAWSLFQDRPTTRIALSCVLIVMAALMANAPGSVALSDLPSLLLAVFAPAGFGFAIAVLVHRLYILPPLARLGSASLGAVLGLLPLILTSAPAEVLPDSGSDWVMILGIALASAFVPQLIFVICSPIVGAARSSVLGSVELPTMFAVGLLVFGEQITLPHGLACALILAAIVLASPTSRPLRLGKRIGWPHR